MEQEPVVVTIACPHFSPLIYTEVMQNIIGFVRKPYISAQAPLIMPPKRFSVSLATIRNMIVEHALKADCTHIFWMDGDQVSPLDTVEQLLKHDRDIIGGWAMVSSGAYPNTYRWRGKNKRKHLPTYPSGLTEVDRMGFGCVLTKKEVFEKIEYPWFQYTKRHNTEDLYFCDKAKEAGYKIWVDSNVRSMHLDLEQR